MAAEETPAGLVKGRVSLVVPCYNVERFLDRFLQSIRAQTYKDLEIVLVDDGSTDGTGQILREAVPAFEAEGYQVTLIEQANKGLGGAVDTGLKHFNGEFLMWPDPDDWLSENSVERRVALMREHPDIALLRTNARLYIDETGEFDGLVMPLGVSPSRPVELFEQLLFLGTFFAPVCHMVRSKPFLAVHPDRSIYFGPESSQNFQLLVPLVEAFPVLQVHEPLAFYRIRRGSRSRVIGHEAAMKRYDQLLDLAEQTLPKLKTFRPEALEVLQNYHWRERMLPTAFRAAMRKRADALIERSALSPARKHLAHILLGLRCNRAFRAVDEVTAQIASRALARLFDHVVGMPKKALRWGAGPLWSAS